MYPLKFKPILKTVVWGGEKIASYKGLCTKKHNIGESWELSGLKGNESVVAEGPLMGKSISEVMKLYGKELMGACTDSEFPILVKFIDAHEDLSIQVHPNDEIAARRHGSKGKTEMWYVISAEPGACLYSGLTSEITPEEYAARVADNTITEVMAQYPVQAGDVFYLPAGRIHSIGSGCFIAEIHQTSDITYRIYDYNRPGLDGRPRELHTELAKDAIDYSILPDYRTQYNAAPDRENEIIRCPYFTASLLDVDEEYEKDLKGLDSFLVIVCVDGAGTFVCIDSDGTHEVSLRQGETALVSASSSSVRFLPAPFMKLLLSHL